MFVQLVTIHKITYVKFLLGSADLGEITVSLPAVTDESSSTWSDFHNPPSGDIWHCLQTFLVANRGGNEEQRLLLARDAAKHPTMHRTVAHNEESSSPKYQ